jgi:hypothetical protein
MPAVTCGSNFDSRLDSANGYYDFSSSNSSQQLNQFAPGANLTPSDVQYSGGSTNSTSRRRSVNHLHRRSFWSSLKKIAHAAVAAVQKVAAVAVAVTKNIPIVSNVVQSVAKDINTVFAVVGTVVVSRFCLSPSLLLLASLAHACAQSLVTDQPTTAGVTFTWPVGVNAPNHDDSPWGSANKIFECNDEKCGLTNTEENNKEVAKMWAEDAILATLNDLGLPEQPEPGVRVYCVNCGVGCSFSVSGSITVQLTSGVKDAQISLAGNLHAGVELGVDFLAVYEHEIGRASTKEDHVVQGTLLTGT